MNMDSWRKIAFDRIKLKLANLRLWNDMVYNDPLYIVSCAFFSVFLFLFAFFPLNYNSNFVSTFEDIPKSIVYNDTKESVTIVLKDKLNKAVDNIALIVIDALRVDFVTPQNFPFVFKENNACLFHCLVTMPTVTMPRIKSIATGTVSNYIDILMNFGNNTIGQDNIIKQAVNNNKTVVFYGDNTWKKLFPHEFKRSEGTDSFFVHDFKEVDDNVTRNVLMEINNYDWQMMILHYLGLDHIGHVEGHKSSKIPGKLREMDNVIQILYKYFTKRQQLRNESFLIMVCGDHGMKDGGGHGGYSHWESLTPLITLGFPCVSPMNTSIFQVDIAPTIAVLWGIPIPSGTIGSIIPGLISHLSESYQLFLYYYNLYHFNNFTLNDDMKRTAGKTIKLHSTWLKKQNTHGFKTTMFEYKHLLVDITRKLLLSYTKLDVLLLIISCVMMFQASMLSLENHVVIKMRWLSLILHVLIVVCTAYVGNMFHRYNSIIISSSFFSTLFVLFVSILISYNDILFGIIIITRFKEQKFDIIKPCDSICIYLLSATILQIISAFSTSFIEEEHLVWYFLWNTFLLMLFLMPMSRKQKKVLLSLFFLHRILSKLNQTGIKWVSIPDLGDWFETHNVIYSIFTITNLILSIFACHYINSINKGLLYRNKMFNMLDTCFIIMCHISIYVYKTVTDKRLFHLKFGSSSYEKSAFLFYIRLIITFIIWKMAVILLDRRKSERRMIYIELLKVLLISWCTWCNILLKSVDIILPCSLIYTSVATSKLLKQSSNLVIFKYILIHHWLAYIFFFYQGNSNDISSVDVTVGYIGQSEFNFSTAAIFIFCKTYACAILSAMLLTLHILNYTYKLDLKLTRSTLNSLLTCICANMVVYMIVIIVHKDHLFIWSVFTPKLLYLSIYTVGVFFFYIIWQYFCILFE